MGETVRMMSAEYRDLPDADLIRLLRDVCVSMTIPRNAGRTNIDAKPRSLLLGLYTRRGMGLGVRTSKHLQLLALVHTLAQRREGKSAMHPYCSIMVNRLDSGQELTQHQDEYNSLLNWVMPLCADANDFRGGEMWLETGTPTTFVHRANECPLDLDAFTVAGVATTDSDEHLTVDGVAGCVIQRPNHWLCFDSRRKHCVRSVVSGTQISIA
eukprot:4696746-Amphidinium_carterae.3